jgi:hypothetical protein
VGQPDLSGGDDGDKAAVPVGHSGQRTGPRPEE